MARAQADRARRASMVTMDAALAPLAFVLLAVLPRYSQAQTSRAAHVLASPSRLR